MIADISYHEIAHRELFKNALNSTAIGNLQVHFSCTNNRDGELEALITL